MARIATGQLTLYDYNDTLVAGVAPVDPTLNSLWLDNSVSPTMMKKWNGSGWTDVGEMDPNYSETVTAIQTTLNNMANDGLLDYTDRQKLKDEIAEITGTIILDNASAPTGAALDAGTAGSYRRVRKAALAAGILPAATAYTDLSTAYTTLANFLNARTPKPWDVSTTNKATPTPVDKAAFRSAWLGYYNAQAALSEETSSSLSSSISTLKTTTLTALENKMLSEAEKSSIQVSLNVTVKEKGEIDATTAGFVANSNLVNKTLVSTPKGLYDTAYNALIAAMNDVLDEPLGQLIADAKITAVNNAFTTYGTRIAAMRTAFQTAQKAIETQVEANADNAIATALTDYVSLVSYNEDMEAIQSQVDGAITTWFGSVEPTLMNIPASDWTTVVLKDVHLGDLYYDDVSGYAYRFSYKNAVYSWILIHDTDIADALAAANKAQDTADAKRRVFYVQPVPPYDVGDLWTQGISGELMRATVARAEGASYVASDWARAVKYTDDSAANTAQQAAEDAQTDADTANGKLNDIASDAKLTAVEKQATRNEWNAIASEAVSNSSQATTFAVSATAYQNALAALATYLNGGTALTYVNVTAGSIPLWINDANLATTTDIVGATYRTTWKTYYDARVALLNAIAAEARRLANVAQQTADNVDVGGTNIFWTSGQFTDTITNWSSNGGGLVADNTTQWNGFRTIRTTVGSGIVGNWYKLENNVEYTYSMLIKSDIAFTGTSSTPVHYHAGKDNLNQSKITVVKSSTTYLAGDIGKWKKLYVTFKLNSDADSFRPFVYFGASPLAVLNIAYLKLEKGNRATDWNPAPEDTAARIAASNLVINNLRQSLDNKQNIRMGMKLGYSSFSTVNASYLYLCGLTPDPVTFAEVLSDTNGTIYDSNTKVSITIPKQAVNLTGIPALTKGYLAWDNADGTTKVWFIVLTNTYVNNVMTSSKWMKRNIGAVGDNTEMVLDEAVYILGELEI